MINCQAQTTPCQCYRTFSPMAVCNGSSVSPRASPAEAIRLCILPNAILDHVPFVSKNNIQSREKCCYLFISECTYSWAAAAVSVMSIMSKSSWYSHSIIMREIIVARPLNLLAHELIIYFSRAKTFYYSSLFINSHGEYFFFFKTSKIKRMPVLESLTASSFKWFDGFPNL